MGDLPHGSRPQALDIAATGIARDTPQNVAFPSSSPYKSSGGISPFQSQLSTIPYGQTQPDSRSLSQVTGQYAQQQELGASALNMGSMAGSLPNYSVSDDALLSPQGQSAARPLSGASASALAYQLGHNLQMPTHASGALPNHSSYGAGYAYQQTLVPSQGSLHGGYTPYLTNQPRHPGSSIQSSYQNFPQSQQYMYYSNPYSAPGQFAPSYLPQNTSTQAMYGRRTSLSGTQSGVLGQNSEATNLENGFPGSRTLQGGHQNEGGGIGAPFGTSLGQTPGLSRIDPVSSIPRGPPRKPKQSGHALWVGNLPPGTTVVTLKDHFSREATKDIESLFLISKSNCAFVNYRSEASCTAAMHRFHDSRFNGVRLVCRLRRSSTPASGIPTGPSAMVGTQGVAASPPSSPTDVMKPSEGLQGEAPASPEQKAEQSNATEAITTANKYFIVKSLTLQDLDLSVRNGIWATQSHNETALNKAYSTAENVYLIFSANKSGEYFGYARMVSPIQDEDATLANPPPKIESAAVSSDAPKSIPTQASEWAPKGRIIDDSARGTIFWEADHSESDEDVKPERNDTSNEVEAPTVAQSWGKPFKIQWISTTRLPFYRTRGLRNPWNANREVKIARDGTELEPSVGERLIQMFHRVGPPNAGIPAYPPHNQFGGPGIGPMRTY